MDVIDEIFVDASDVLVALRITACPDVCDGVPKLVRVDPADVFGELVAEALHLVGISSIENANVGNDVSRELGAAVLAHARGPVEEEIDEVEKGEDEKNGPHQTGSDAYDDFPDGIHERDAEAHGGRVVDDPGLAVVVEEDVLHPPGSVDGTTQETRSTEKRP